MTDTGSVTAGSKKKKIAFLLQDGVTCRTALVDSPIHFVVAPACVEPRQRRWEAQHHKVKCEAHLTTTHEAIILRWSDRSIQSKIGNPKSNSLDHPIRSRQHVWRNREADLLGGFEIDG
jgi:hypothetical protein